ncbi:MAG: sortase, partial [Chloroflexi bacterium]|nr:sortase [Chloroflexota bacterium]
MANGETVTAEIPANAAQDAVGNDNTASTSTDNSVTYDTSAITIVSNGVVGQPNNTILQDLGTYDTHFTRMEISFNTAAYNPAGNSDPDDVTNPNNYLLIQSGANLAYDTDSCLAYGNNGNSVLGDDVQIPTGAVTYDAGAFTATVVINNGTPLPPGEYRLIICGTTSITDLAENALNDGTDSSTTFTILASLLPATGFPHGRITSLPEQPAAKAYTETAMTLEIPKLGVNIPIVGVPQTENGWDVTWLGNSAGYLAGSAFPTWEGNTVITGHVWDAYNQPGAFADLKTLKYGDQIQIHAWGQTYIYEVRERDLLLPNRVSSVMQHEELDWVTLVTCEFYNPFT